MTHRMRSGLLAAAFLLAAGCRSEPLSSQQALVELQTTPNSPRRQLEAMSVLDRHPEADAEQYLADLHRALWVPQYNMAVREAALERLEARDREGLARTIRQRLPNLTARRWLGRLCEIIADRGWSDLTSALVSSWSRTDPLVQDEAERPEYLALARLHGEAAVPEVVFKLMVEADRAWQQGFRTRCWTLLHRIGERHRLVDLLRSATIDEDAMLLDLRAAAVDLGLVPHNREEILRVRKLREPGRERFWSQAVSAVHRLPAARRRTLELRDLAIVVSADLHAPDLLAAGEDELARRLEAALREEKHFAGGSLFDGPYRSAQRLADVRERLTWGDLAAMLIARRALEVPEVIEHLFDYAERDRRDESTEYGGVLDLDERGRFEVLEFPPRIRHHDQKFIASQAMFDAACTALFHFHFHVQQIRNEDFAGPGLGDGHYADATRANCLVLTSVGDGRMNVDYYRHHGVVVDLGVVQRR